MDIFTDPMAFIAAICFIFVLILGLSFILGTIETKPQPVDFTQQEKRLEKEREYFNMVGLVTYWALEAANEIEDLDPDVREEIVKAVDAIDDLIVEDRIYFDIDVWDRFKLYWKNPGT